MTTLELVSLGPWLTSPQAGADAHPHQGDASKAAQRENRERGRSQFADLRCPHARAREEASDAT